MAGEMVRNRDLVCVSTQIQNVIVLMIVFLLTEPAYRQPQWEHKKG